jgi:hypothetical protein
MKKFFYGCLVLLNILFIVLILSGCNLINIESPQKSQSGIEIPDGWIQLKTDDFSIYLPDSWEGGNAQEFDTLINEQFEITPTETANPDNKLLLVFWAYDTASSSDVPPTFNVLRVSSDISSLKDYMYMSYKNIEAANKELHSKYKTVVQQILKMASYNEVARTITSQEILGNNLRMAQYIIKDDKIYWIMTFSAAQKDFDASIDYFDRAIQTTAFK